MQSIQEILKIIIKRIKYPNWFDIDGDGNTFIESEEDYQVYRDELSVLFLNIALIKPFHQTLLMIIA